MAGQPEVSVVVATHDREQRLAALLESLRAQTLERDAFEVIVVNDASTDGTPALLRDAERRSDLPLRVIHRPEAHGPAAARNEGWRAARAPLVAFTDDDCVVAPHWLEAALEGAQRRPGAILQGRTDPIPDEYPGFTPFHHTVVVDRAGPSFETCNIFYPHDLLKRLGGFDETSFSGPGGEDTDLAWRAIGGGVETRFVERAQAFHAVTWLGPVGKLRMAARWHETMLCFARFPELRRHLIAGVFWKWNHYALARAALAMLLPRRWRALRWWLAAPYLRFLTNRRSGPLLAPYLVLHDLVEIGATVRGAVRYRTFIV